MRWGVQENREVKVVRSEGMKGEISRRHPKQKLVLHWLLIMYVIS
jgi:hypothetical protein